MLRHKFIRADQLKQPVAPKNTVGHGDCRSLLGSVYSNSIDLVVTDPSDLSVSGGKQFSTRFNETSETIIRQSLSELHRVLKSGSYIVLLCGRASPEYLKRIALEAGLSLMQTVWMERRWFTIKTNIDEGKEYVLVLAKGEPYKPFKPFRCPMPWQYSGTPLHPSQTAIGVLKPFIKSLSRKGDIVLDPFCGSGSTLCAAKELERNYLGIDIDGLYVNRARRRLSRM